MCRVLCMFCMVFCIPFLYVYTRSLVNSCLFIHQPAMSHTQKKEDPFVSLPFENPERKGQDSNLRTSFAGYTLSRRASSTTRAPFRRCFRFESGAKVSKNADMFQTILVFFCLRAMVLSFGIVRLLSLFVSCEVTRLSFQHTFEVFDFSSEVFVSADAT